MITVIIEFRVKPALLQTFLDATATNLQARRAADGCLRVELFQRDDDPHELWMIEQFASQPSIDAYYDTASYHEWHMIANTCVDVLNGADYHPL